MHPLPVALYQSFLSSFDLLELSIPISFVKLFRGDTPVPEAVLDHAPFGITLTSCQAERQAVLGDSVCLTRENIGCVAAALSFGLVSPDESEPLSGPRVYTEIMKDQVGDNNAFAPPSPADFQEGRVYACTSENRPEFALFGPEDSGRFKNIETAKKAIADMVRIEPADTKAVLFYHPDEADAFDFEPDVVIAGLRPVELTRMVQGWQFITGERIQASMGGLRVMNSDLIARPYLTGEINVSSYCLGARLIARYGADRMGVGIPYHRFETLCQGMEESRTGFPFSSYPGAVPC